jgi:hypothetical protein
MGTEGLARRREYEDPAAKETRMARIEQIEDEIFERSAGIVNAALSFSEIAHNQDEPPDEWIAELGLEAARQKLAVAKAGWLPASIAPNALKLAAQTMTGISRGRAYRVKITQQNLNVKLTLPAPTSAAHPGPTVYEVRDLET